VIFQERLLRGFEVLKIFYIVAPLIIAGIADVSEEYIARIVSLHIAHLRQECHNSKFGIFKLLV
jgi:hypothetical protein